MTKAQILEEIRRTAAANNGIPLGYVRFENVTGIRYSDWFGVHWARWGDALRKAGFSANRLNEAHGTEFMYQRIAEYTQELGRLPVRGDLRLKRKSDPTFPSWNTFDRLGSKTELVGQLAEYCRPRPEFAAIAELCD